MGAGKSTIGRLLAKELRLPFKDSDKEIELRTGTNIPWIFDKEGEAGFRDRETAMIKALCNEDGIVLATGGGAVMRPVNREYLHAGGRVVYLHASIEQQVARTSRDRNRPCCAMRTPRKSCAICWPFVIRFTVKSPTSSSKPMNGRRGWWFWTFLSVWPSFLPVKALVQNALSSAPALPAQR
jgi:shikimate kinase